MTKKINPSLLAFICPCIAGATVVVAYFFANSPIWLFLSLGAALLTAVVGVLFSILMFTQKSFNKTKAVLCLFVNVCAAAFCAIYLFGAIVIGIGLIV
jgi:hypothetical protein